MKPCMVGIGGAGGNILKQFLRNQDANLMVHQFGDPLAFGDVKGVWLESAPQDVQRQSFYGSLVDGCYPPYLICHGKVSDSSTTRSHIMDTYGFDLKADGFDRRAEYLKAMFEIFEVDSELKAKCSDEFKSQENPLSRYMWRVGVRPFTTISTGKSTEDIAKHESKAQESKEGRSRHLPSILGNLVGAARLGNGKGMRLSKHCDSILFLASLGGGTGTGFINPITSFVRSEEGKFFIFALGILTEKGTDDRHAAEGQRYLGAVIAMYDLLTKESGQGIDGLMLIDNQILKDQFEGDFPAMDSHIFEAMKPLLDERNYPGYQLQDDAPAIRRVFWEVDAGNGLDKKDKSQEMRLLPPMFVPCYNSQPDTRGDIDTLVDGALGRAGSLYPLGKDGRLFPCDPNKADRALVFTRGFFREEEIAEAVARRTHLSYVKKEGKIEGDIKIYRKLGDSRNEDILILLRNPYGGAPGEHKRQGTLEWRLHEIISLAIDYINKNEENILGFQSYKKITKDKLWDYFYGEKGLSWELHNCLDRIEDGDRPVFKTPLKIFRDTATTSDSSESCLVRPEILAGDRYDLRELVKSELREILRSEDCRKRIKEILQS